VGRPEPIAGTRVLESLIIESKTFGEPGGVCGVGDCVPQPILVELDVTGDSKPVDLCKVRVPSIHLQTHGYSTNIDDIAGTVAGNKQTVGCLVKTYLRMKWIYRHAGHAVFVPLLQTEQATK